MQQDRMMPSAWTEKARSAPASSVASDSVAGRLAELREWQEKLTAVRDVKIHIDDVDRFERTSVFVEANMLLARHRLVSAPPEDESGVTLLLRYGLSVTDDPCLAAIIKSCLVTLLGMAPPPDARDAEEIPDEAFDAAVDWPDSDCSHAYSGPIAR